MNQPPLEQTQMPENPSPAGTLVSVVIPAYNAQATLGETLRSVLAQTHRNLEIVVVDDGSTDDTWQLMQGFGAAIRPIHQRNAGIAATRNAGLAAARGDFIALLDADDLCEPERIAVQLKYLQEHPDVLLCSSDFSGFDAQGSLGTSYCGQYYARCHAVHGGPAARYPEHGTQEISDCLPGAARPTTVPVYQGRVYAQLALGNFVHPPTVMFRRKAIDLAGMFDPDIKIVCEWEWFVRVARVGPIGFIDRPLLRYRRSSTQISSDPRTPLDSLAVARRIHGRDPDLRKNDAGEVRRHLGALSLDAAYALSELERGRALRLLLSSLFASRTFNAKTLRTLFKIATPATLLGRVRRLRARLA